MEKNVMKYKLEDIEKAYNEVFKELQDELKDKETELERVVINKIKFSIREDACGSKINAQNKKNEYNVKAQETENNIPILKNEIQFIKDSIDYLEINKNSILNNR